MVRAVCAGTQAVERVLPEACGADVAGSAPGQAAGRLQQQAQPPGQLVGRHPRLVRSPHCFYNFYMFSSP